MGDPSQDSRKRSRTEEPQSGVRLPRHAVVDESVDGQIDGGGFTDDRGNHQSRSASLDVAGLRGESLQ